MELSINRTTDFKKKYDVIQKCVDLILFFLLGISLFFFKNQSKIITYISILMIGLIVFSKIENIVYYLFLFFPYYMFLLIKGFQMYNLILILFLIKYFLKNIFNIKIEIFLLPLILSFLEIIFSIETQITTEMIKWLITSLVFSVLLFDPPKNVDIQKCIKYFVTGMFILAISIVFFNSKQVVDDYSRNHLKGIAFIEKNTYSIYGCVSLMSILYILKYEFRNKIIYLIPFSVILFSSFMTISKTFLLIFLLSLLLYIINVVRSYKSLFTLVIVIFVSVIVIISNDYLLGLFNSYISRFEQASNFDELTTGRWGIFMEYGDYLLSHPKALIFGEGLFSYDKIVRDTFIIKLKPHNLELELLISWGLIGTIAIIYLISKYYKHAKLKLLPQKNFLATIPFISLLLGLQAITLIYQNVTMIVFIYCFYIMLFNQKKES